MKFYNFILNNFKIDVFKKFASIGRKYCAYAWAEKKITPLDSMKPSLHIGLQLELRAFYLIFDPRYVNNYYISRACS